MARNPWRPTKYTPDLLEKAEDYLINYSESGDVIPSIEGLAEHLDVSRTCLYTWRSQADKIEFSYILDKLLEKQARVLINQGLKGEFNAAIAKLALGKHGYHDKQSTELSGPDGGAIESNVKWSILPVTPVNDTDE